MRTFAEFVRATVENLESAGKIPLGRSSFPHHEPRSSGAPAGLIFSPHPDDECISGGLPLRLFRQQGFRIVNVPVTLGSDTARRGARRRELENACRFLGFEIEFPNSGSFETITPEFRRSDSINWNLAVDKTAELIGNFEPKIVFTPHRNDRHPAHCGTNLLVIDALRKMPQDFSCIIVENEYWQAMETPNCLVELDEKTVSDLIAALTFHAGEVERNPYHLTFPSWLIDNVRRGSEIVGKAGAESQNFTFGILHKISIFKNGELTPKFENGAFLSMESDLEILTKLI